MLRRKSHLRRYCVTNSAEPFRVMHLALCCVSVILRNTRVTAGSSREVDGRSRERRVMNLKINGRAGDQCDHCDQSRARLQSASRVSRHVLQIFFGFFELLEYIRFEVLKRGSGLKPLHRFCDFSQDNLI